jgi:hypothetical protein
MPYSIHQPYLHIRKKPAFQTMTEVYVIVLMGDFTMPGTFKQSLYLHDICLSNRDTGEVFYEGLGFFYLELINFVKDESSLETNLDR